MGEVEVEEWKVMGMAQHSVNQNQFVWGHVGPKPAQLTRGFESKSRGGECDASLIPYRHVSDSSMTAVTMVATMVA